MIGASRNGRRFRVLGALALPLLFLIGGIRFAEPQAQPPGNGLELEDYRISVNVDLVVLQATVRDGKGRFSSDLRERDFEIYEDGVRQSIRLFRHEDAPVTVGLVVDHSGSMRRKLADVIAAARTFVHSSNPDDEMFVVNFNERVSLGLAATHHFTNQLGELESAILQTPATGRTALYDAIAKALDELRGAGCEKKVLIVISDGGDNASKRKLADVLRMADQSGAMLYTIGIFDDEDPDRNPGVLHRLASATGGEAYIPENFAELPAVCERIARDIRHQYTIGYVSTNPAKAGAYHNIRVAAKAPGAGRLSVRARDGYIVAGESRTGKNEGAR